VKQNIETCKKFLQLTADLGGKGVKVRPNGVTKGKTIEQTCDQIGKALIECGKTAAELGLDVSVEVHGKTTQEPKNMKLIMDACAHPSVGVTWNSNNTDVVDGSIAKNFDLLAKHIRSCHINDLKRDKEGKYPYRELFSLLKKIGYDRYTMIEYSPGVEPKEGEEFLKKYKALWTELVAG
jgi:sugar phosphate isomerase/epimerase